MQSKGHLRLVNRLNDFMGDYEFAQIIYSCRNFITDKNGNLKYLDATRHAVLSKRDATPQTRTIIANHLRSTIAVSFIKEAYEEVTEYIHYILKMGAMSGKIKPEKISDSIKVNLTANQILATRTHEEVMTLVTKEIYQQLESERSTKKLIKKTTARLGLNVKEELIERALKYLDMRHIFVHEDGKPNRQFKEDYPDIKLNQKGRINLTETNLHNVCDDIKALIDAIDSEMISKGLIIEQEMQP